MVLYKAPSQQIWTRCVGDISIVIHHITNNFATIINVQEKDLSLRPGKANCFYVTTTIYKQLSPVPSPSRVQRTKPQSFVTAFVPPSPSSISQLPSSRVQRSVPEVVLQIGSTSVGEQQSAALVVSSLTITITVHTITTTITIPVHTITMTLPDQTRHPSNIYNVYLQ